MILGIIEHDRGVIEATSLQMLTLGRGLAEQTGTSLEAALIGDDSALLEETIKPFGMAAIHRVTHPQLDDYAPAAWAEAAIQLGRARGAQAILAPGSDRGNEILAHVAAKTGLAMAANCAQVEAGDVYRVVRLRWGSSLLEEAELSGAIKLLSVAPHTVEATEARCDNVTVEDFEPVPLGGRPQGQGDTARRDGEFRRYVEDRPGGYRRRSRGRQRRRVRCSGRPGHGPRRNCRRLARSHK